MVVAIVFPVNNDGIFISDDDTVVVLIKTAIFM